MPEQAPPADLIRMAIAAHQAGRIAEAEAGYHRVLAADPGNFDAQHLLGVIALQRGDHALAVRLIAAAASADPANPLYADAYNNLAVALRALGRLSEALIACRQMVALKPESGDAHFNLGNLYRALQDPAAALNSYETAARLDPQRADVHYNRGIVLFDLGRRADALAACQQAWARAPDLPFLFGMIVYLKAQVADWHGLEADLTLLAQQIAAGKPAIYPFYLMSLLDSPALQLASARTWMDAHFPGHEHARAAPPTPGAKLRVGYFSMDFRNHLVGFIAASLFEHHDRTKIELYAFSYGPDPQPKTRQRFTAAVDGFFEVRAKSDAEISALARELKIDVAVDLAGHTQNSRPGIFAARAAPVQIGFLGYAGTFGSPAMDYILADRTVLPAAARPAYAEKVLALPDSFFPPVAEGPKPLPSTRARWSLPETGFVFCCFNTATKIMPRMFACWMRILARTPGSVLWLRGGTPYFNTRLLNEAKRADISAARIIFAGRADKADHIARQPLADLFLDTLPFNGHTTVRDALLAGLPVLTLQGETFAARVAASLLQAVGLPELITTTWDDYEERAVALAADPARIGALRSKLAAQRGASAFTDTVKYMRSLEEAFARAAERAAKNLPPDHILL